MAELPQVSPATVEKTLDDQNYADLLEVLGGKALFTQMSFVSFPAGTLTAPQRNFFDVSLLLAMKPYILSCSRKIDVAAHKAYAASTNFVELQATAAASAGNFLTTWGPAIETVFQRSFGGGRVAKSVASDPRDLRLAYQPGPQAVLSRGSSEVRLQASHVNVWAQMPGYFLDGEWSRLQLHWRVGVGTATELSLDAGLLARGGGVLDGPIERFHAAFGITQSRRDRYQRNRLRLDRRDADGQWRQVPDGSATGVSVAKPVLGARHALWHGPSGQRLTADLALGLPLGDARRQFAVPGAELLGGVTMGAPLGAGLALHAAFGVTAKLWGGSVYQLPPSMLQKYLFAALTWAPSRHIELALHYLNQDGAVESARYAPLDKTTHEFALGIRALLRPHWSVELAILENSVHDANTPDVGVTIGLARLDRLELPGVRGP